MNHCIIQEVDIYNEPFRDINTHTYGRGGNVEIEILVKQAKQGNKEALVTLIMHKKDDFYRLAYVYMKNKEDSLDMVEDMILILYKNIKSLKNESSFYSWSKTILVNCCKKALKKKSKIVYFNEVPEEIYEENFSYNEDKILINAHLAKLSKKQQEVLRLRYFMDLDYETISETLKIPKGTVKSRISIGLNKLKNSLGGECFE